MSLGDDLTMVFFPNETMDIYSICEEDYDYYGKKTNYTYKETVEVDIQPYSPTSSLREFGKILQDTYKVYLDKDTIINDTDQLIINNNKYEIIGSVENWNHKILPHKKILIKKQRKEADTNGG